MPAAIVIEHAGPTDLAPVLDLLQTHRLPPAGLADHLATTLVARHGAAVVGSAALEMYGESALLRSVAVEPTLRGQQLGTRLTEAAFALARSRGVRRIYLLTTTAGDFFPRFGFRRITRADVDPAVQRSVEFTSACPASALVMACEI
jgi:amino-acid N-acetyltransferase